MDCRVTIELLDTESDDTEKCVTNTQAWSNYVDLLTNPAAGPTASGVGGAGSTTAVSNRPSGLDGTSTSSTNQEVEVKIEKSDDELVSNF